MDREFIAGELVKVSKDLVARDLTAKQIVFKTNYKVDTYLEDKYANFFRSEKHLFVDARKKMERAIRDKLSSNFDVVVKWKGMPRIVNGSLIGVAVIEISVDTDFPDIVDDGMLDWEYY
jgi:hypothetical protein